MAAQSRERACQSDDQCVAVTGPQSRARDLFIVVHRIDADAIEAKASALLEACGANAITDPGAGYVNVSGDCIANTCTTRETSVSPLDFPM